MNQKRFSTSVSLHLFKIERKRRILWTTIRAFSISLSLAAFFYCLLAAGGCSTGVVGSAIGDPRWSGTILRKKCILKKKSVPLKVNRPGSANQQCTAGYGYQAHLKSGDPIYCDKSLPGTPAPVLVNAGFEQFRQATVAMLSYKDRKNDTKDWLEIEVQADTAGYYLAYDSGIQPAPDWLHSSDSDYELWPNAQGNPYYITVTGQQGPVNLTVYRWKKDPPKKGDTITVNGNKYGTTASTKVPTDVMMYLAFFVPQVEDADWDCTTNPHAPIPPEDKTYGTSVCAADEQKAKQELMKECVSDPNRLYNMRCDDTSATVKKQKDPCPSKTSGLTLLSYPVSSVIQFNPSLSTAKFTLEGESPVSKKVSGVLDFEYIYDDKFCMCLKQMKVNNMYWEVDAFEIEGQKFTDTAVSLNKAVKADCDDWKNQIGKKPCPYYIIAQNEFSCNVGSKHNNAPLLIVVDNNLGPMKVRVDETARQLRVDKTVLTTTILVDGKPKKLTIEFELFGDFLNFAPHAAGNEETVSVECQERRNQHSITLNASLSFDIAGTVATPLPVNYLWYEDYGLSSEKYLGTGLTWEIKPHTMTFGVHHITLVVVDAVGIAGTDTFEVTVEDTQAPEITAPSDVQALSCIMLPSGQFGAVSLNLGQAQASDGCQLGEVWVTNDAPPGHTFFPGEHTVTWTASDGSGNTSQDTQDVYVYSPPQLADIDIGAAQLVGNTLWDDDAIFTTAGGADIWGTADQFNYTLLFDPNSDEPLLPVEGDFTAIVAVRGMEPHATAHEWAKAGIMFRESLEPGSPHVMAIRSLRNGATLQGRDGEGWESWQQPMGAGYAENDTVWLRLDRKGNTFTGSYAIGGETAPATWIASSTHEVDGMADAYVGLATTSHEQEIPITVQYTDFRVGPYQGLAVIAEPELPHDSPPGGDGYMGIREVIDNGETRNQGACYASLNSGTGMIVDHWKPVLNIHDGGGNGNYGDDHVFGVVEMGYGEPGGVDHLSMIVRGTIHVPEGYGGDYTFGVNSDDGFTLQFPGLNFVYAANGEIADFASGAALRFYRDRASADTLGVIELPAGDHPFWLTFHERQGSAAVEFFAARGAYGVFDPVVFQLVGSVDGLQLVGQER